MTINDIGPKPQSFDIEHADEAKTQIIALSLGAGAICN